MTKPLSILLVEDNPKFIDGAARFFNGFQRSELSYLEYAGDYQRAIDALNQRFFNSAIIDCFFPYASNSDNRVLGNQAIEKMLATDERGKRIEEYERELAPYFHTQDQGVRRIVRYIGSLSREQKPVQSSVVQVAKLIGGIDKDKLGQILKQDAKWLFKGIEHFKDHYDELRALISRDPFNQPLGILIAEECEQRGLPFVLATSTYHHDALTQPIQDYCGRKGWTLVDCNQNNPNEKASPEFWQRAYNALVRKSGGKIQ